jgi:hypothetical protein
VNKKPQYRGGQGSTLAVVPYEKTNDQTMKLANFLIPTGFSTNRMSEIFEGKYEPLLSYV